MWKQKTFFSIYLPLVKGLDIVYLWERPPWMWKQKKFVFPFTCPWWRDLTLSIFEKDHHRCEAKNFFFHLLALNEGTWYCVSSRKTTMDAQANYIFFHLLALSEGTWHCLSSRKTTIDVKAKKNFFFHLLALNEGTWHSLSLSETTMNARANPFSAKSRSPLALLLPSRVAAAESPESEREWK